jgi:hypothetical protein
MIGRLEMQRADSLWVVYQDGYQVHCHHHARQPEAWAPLLDRPLADWGKLRH